MSYEADILCSSVCLRRQAQYAVVLLLYIVICLIQEKGNGALHIATQANQSSQVELLLVYGADPGSFDAHGRTPADIARFFFLSLSFEQRLYQPCL